MKNYAILFSLALTLGFTSCKNENKEKETETEEMTTETTELQEAPAEVKINGSLRFKKRKHCYR